MPRFSLGLNQRRLNGTTAVGKQAINLGATRGKGSSTRMYNYCTNTSPAPSLCIYDFITVNNGSAPPTPSGPTVPGTPVITNIVAGDQELIINFTAPSNGGTPITDYLYSINGGITFTSSNDITSPITITGLTNNVTYQVSIKAVNAIGTGIASPNITGTPTSANQGWVELGADAPTPFTSLYTTPGTIRVVKYNQSQNKVYVAGDFKNSSGYEFVAVYDVAANNWSELGNIAPIIGATGSIKALIFDTNNNLYIGGDFRSMSAGVVFVAKYDGSTWSELGNLADNTFMIVNGSINCLTSDSQNRIYAAGNFQYFDSGQNWRYVARYTPNTNTWVRLPIENNNFGQQFNGELFTIKCDETNQGTFIYVAGDAYTTSGSYPNPTGIRKIWTYLEANPGQGSGWGFLPDGVGVWPYFIYPTTISTYMFNGPIYAIESQWAGGAFTYENNLTPQTTNYFLAQSQWIPYPSNYGETTFSGPFYNGAIRTISTQSQLFVAGDFNYVANGFNGSPLGNPSYFNNSILSISYNAPVGRLYAGGAFTNIQGKIFVAMHIP